MKRLYGAIVLIALASVTTGVNAAQCSTPLSGWVNITENTEMEVRVTVRQGADPSRILLEGGGLLCRFTPRRAPEWEDYWRTAASPWQPSGKFSGFNGGLQIHGAHYNNPVPEGILLATMPDDTRGYSLNTSPYILRRGNPANPIVIYWGDILGRVTFIQTDNYSGRTGRLTVRYVSGGPTFVISPSTCTINNNNPIEINFGDVDQRAIGTDPLGTTIRTNRTLTYACPNGGVNADITITYQGTPSSFNPNLLGMSNPDVGTALVRGGAAVPVNGSFRARINNSVGSDTVTFSLVKRAGSQPIAGPISGSGVLVMGVP